jgi:hypothetical protein
MMAYDPKQMFSSARGFAAATQAVSREHSRTIDFSLLSPIITLSSITLEIYLKCIFNLENNKNSNDEHNLLRIFKSLKIETQKAIEDYYNSYLANDRLAKKAKEELGIPFDLNIYSVLKEISNSFEKWRYPYEHGQKGYPGVYNIINATQDYIVKTHPEIL